MITVDDVKASLKVHGYEVTADDEWLIENEIKKIIIDAKNKTNRNTLPDELDLFMVDMVVVNILVIKLFDGVFDSNSNVNADNRVISSISEGDTTIKYESSQNQNKDVTNVHKLISDYSAAYKHAIIRFRRISW